ncbi:MFS-type transporter involved in bile tolerance, Atg22 family [Bowdeniella nasicola]|uniref:MFS-type transporter involved in bile tolerance, Atg22 family n=2 Tax=Bowdeniella nasicola TaxID=208480 RepID=A0A1H4D569_9ACTO|nr:MFS-type transporter involved in bile tolerance, Atg22 family [Bowdeniella nasicola]
MIASASHRSLAIASHQSGFPLKELGYRSNERSGLVVIPVEVNKQTLITRDIPSLARIAAGLGCNLTHQAAALQFGQVIRHRVDRLFDKSGQVRDPLRLLPQLQPNEKVVPNRVEQTLDHIGIASLHTTMVKASHLLFHKHCARNLAYLIFPFYSEVMTNHDMPPKGGPSLWRNRDYLLWFIGDFIADAGSAIRAFAMPLITLAVTGSLTQAGVIGFVSSAASVGLMVPGGLLADRMDRKNLLLLGHVVGLVTWGTGAILYLTDLLTFASLLVLALVAGARSGIFGAVSNTVIKQLVRKEQLPSALAANQGREAVLSLASGPLGGFLLALSTVAPFIAETIGHAMAWGTTRLIRTDLTPRSPDAEPTTWRAQVREGVAWLKAHSTVQRFIAIAALLNIGINGVFSTLVLSLRNRGVGPETIGFVSAALGVGMLLGSFAAPSITARMRVGTIFVVGIGWTVAFNALLAITSSIPVIIAAACLGAIALGPVNSALGGYFMAMIPNSKMGAITSVMGMVTMGLMPFAPLLAGLGLDHWGHVPTMIVMISLFVTGWLMSVFTPSIRSIGRPDEWETGAQNP